MNEVRFPTAAVVAVERCQGDLEVRAGEAEVVVQEAGPEAVHGEVQEGRLLLRLAADARLLVPAAVRLEVGEVQGDLEISGLAGALRLERVAGDATIERCQGPVAVAQVAGDLALAAVRAEVTVEQVAGDLTGRRLGAVRFAQVAGDLVLAEVNGPVVGEAVAGDAAIERVQGTVSLGRVGGDLTVERAGGLTVEAVGGDGQVATIAGPVQLGRLGGDLQATDLTGGLRAPAVGGHARVETGLAPGAEYVVTAEEDLTFVVTEPRAGVFELHAPAGSIRWGLALEEVVEEPGGLRGRLGTDGARVVLTSRRGQVRLRARGAGDAERTSGGRDVWAEVGVRVDLGERFARLSEEIATATRRAVESAFPGGWYGEEAARRAEEQVRRATERVQRMLERLAERFERRSGWRAGAATGAGEAGGPEPRAAGPEGGRGRSDEVRLILELLRDGRLTPEQALRLLDALEGR